MKFSYLISILILLSGCLSDIEFYGEEDVTNNLVVEGGVRSDTSIQTIRLRLTGKSS